MEKYCFDVWCNSNYSDYVVDMLAKELNLSSSEVKRYIERYINCSIEFRDDKKSILKFLLNNSNNHNIVLYRKIFPNDSVDINMADIITAIDKYCYEHCNNVNWNDDEIGKIREFLGLSVGDIRRRAVRYAKNNTLYYEGDKYTEYLSKIRERYKNCAINVFFDKLCETDDEDEIIKLISESGYEAWRLRANASNYVVEYKNDLKDTLPDELKRKIDIYSNYVKEVKAMKRLELKEEKELIILDDALLNIEKFVDGDYGRIYDYISLNGIDLKTFRMYVNVVKKYDKELYARYYEKISNIKSIKYRALLDNIKSIIGLIANGVEDNGCKRTFDLIDYVDITGIPLDEFIVIAKRFNSNNVISKDEFMLLKKFVSFYTSCKSFTNREKASYISSVIEVGSKLNKYGRPILNTGRVITNEEKKAVINYLELRQLPINDKTTAMVLKRYINGSIDLLSNSKVRVKK